MQGGISLQYTWGSWLVKIQGYDIKKYLNLIISLMLIIYIYLDSLFIVNFTLINFSQKKKKITLINSRVLLQYSTTQNSYVHKVSYYSTRWLHRFFEGKDFLWTMWWKAQKDICNTLSLSLYLSSFLSFILTTLNWWGMNPAGPFWLGR